MNNTNSNAVSKMRPSQSRRCNSGNGLMKTTPQPCSPERINDIAFQATTAAMAVINAYNIGNITDEDALAIETAIRRQIGRFADLRQVAESEDR